MDHGEAKERQRVLVVDDCPDTTKTLAILLDHWGHEPLLASDGPAALETARVSRPSIVLLDIGLPKMDGFEVARRLRQLPGMERARIIAHTGHGGAHYLIHSREAGIDHYLLKPCDLSILRSLLAA